MDDGIKASLLYEWKTANARLDFAITEAECQLISVNKRLQDLWHNLLIYVGIIVLPVVLYFILQYVGNWLLRTNYYVVSNTFVYVLLAGVGTVLLCVYLLSLPVLIFHLIKSIFMVVINREDSEQTKSLLPPEAGKVHKEWEREATYRIEQQKLINVLSRYYLYRENMKQLREKIDADSISLTDLKQELKQMTYYEKIHPANEFAGLMSRKTKNLTFLVLVGVIVVILFLLTINSKPPQRPDYDEIEIKNEYEEYLDSFFE